jgi:hypothetical protein
MLKIIMKMALITLLCASTAFSKTELYSEMGNNALNAFLKGETTDVIEFRRGDTIQFNVRVSGDILESITSPSTEIVVKKGFYLKKVDNELFMSWDNSKYLPIRDQMQGHLQASASGDDAISEVHLDLEANQLK